MTEMLSRASSCAICAASSKKVRLATLLTARSDWGERLRTEQEISLQAGWNCRRPSRKSRSCCPSRLWMETRRRCLPIRRPRRANCANSCRSASPWRISSDFRSTSRFSTRSDGSGSVSRLSSDLWSRGRGFDSHPLRCRVRSWPNACLYHQAV